MTLTMLLASTLVAMMWVVTVRAQSDQADRIREAVTVFRETMRAPDSAIPGSVLERAEVLRFSRRR